MGFMWPRVWLECPRWDADNGGVRVDGVEHDGSSAHDRAFPNLHPWQDDRADADVRVRPDHDLAREHNSRRNMAVVPNQAVMLDNGAGVDDAVHANAGLRIDDGAGHYNCSGANPGGFADHRSEEHTSEFQSPCNLVC